MFTLKTGSFVAYDIPEEPTYFAIYESDNRFHIFHYPVQEGKSITKENHIQCRKVNKESHTDIKIRPMSPQEFIIYNDALEGIGKFWDNKEYCIKNFYNPQFGNYVATKDGQVGIMTANGIYKFAIGNYPFDRYANDVQKDAFDKELQKECKWYNPFTQLVEPKFKDGDICVSPAGLLFAYRKTSKPHLGYFYVGTNFNNYIYICNREYLQFCTTGFRHTTDKEIQTFYETLEKKGYHWDATNKEIVNKPKPGDLCIFWDENKSKAFTGFLVEYNKNNHPEDHTGIAWEHCIPYESEEQFRNFIKSE